MTETILIVDDDEDLMEIVAERLVHRGIKVDTATSAETALTRMEKTRYDAIVLDFLLPGMDGFENIRTIRKEHPDIRIILVTGQIPADGGREIKRMGADIVLEKPADLEVLAKAVRSEKKPRHPSPRCRPVTDK